MMKPHFLSLNDDDDSGDITHASAFSLGPLDQIKFKEQLQSGGQSDDSPEVGLESLANHTHSFLKPSLFEPDAQKKRLDTEQSFVSFKCRECLNLKERFDMSQTALGSVLRHVRHEEEEEDKENNCYQAVASQMLMHRLLREVS